MKIKIENTYEDGYSETVYEDVDEPAILTEDWWDGEVWPLTGISRHCSDLGACYTVLVIEADDPDHVGANYEWLG